MSWVTVIWSIGSGACLTLALMNCVVWWKDRTARANLAFSILAVAVAALAALELALMRAETPEQFGMVARWIHVPAWLIVASLVAFVRLYLRAGRRWLAWTVIGVRTLSLILNFVFSPNINYWQITPLRHILFLGESVSVATGVPNPWMLVAQFSLLLLVIFVIDATITVWRRGDRQQALVAGGGIVFFAILASAQAMAVTWEIIPMPITVSLFFQGLVVVMACELSYDVLRAAKLARQLHARARPGSVNSRNASPLLPMPRNLEPGNSTSLRNESGFLIKYVSCFNFHRRVTSLTQNSSSVCIRRIERRAIRSCSERYRPEAATKPNTAFCFPMDSSDGSGDGRVVSPTRTASQRDFWVYRWISPSGSRRRNFSNWRLKLRRAARC